MLVKVIDYSNMYEKKDENGKVLGKFPSVNYYLELNGNRVLIKPVFKMDYSRIGFLVDKVEEIGNK